jgi:hypothetical protein
MKTEAASFVSARFDRSRAHHPPCDYLRARRCRVHRIPCPTSVTIAIRPSEGRDGEGYRGDLGRARSGIFLQMGLDYPNQIDPLEQIRFFKTAVRSPDEANGSARSRRPMTGFCAIRDCEATRQPWISLRSIRLQRVRARHGPGAVRASPACVRIACRRISRGSRLSPPRRDLARRIFRKLPRYGYCPASRQWPCAPWFRGSSVRPPRASTASTFACTCHDNPSSLIALTAPLAKKYARRTWMVGTNRP